MKVAALAIVLMGVPVKLEQIRRTGIRELSEEKIRSVRAAGMRYKLVCRAERRGDGVDCGVEAGTAAGSPIPWPIWKARVPRSDSTWMCLGFRSSSTTPGLKRRATGCSPIFFAPYKRKICQELTCARAIRHRSLGHGQHRREAIRVTEIKQHALGYFARDRSWFPIHHEQRLLPHDFLGIFPFLADAGQHRPGVVAKINGQTHQLVGTRDFFDAFDGAHANIQSL